MKCDYCGRTNSDDGHGGCISCGAPVAQRVYNDWVSGTCCTAVSYSPRTQVERKRVSLQGRLPVYSAPKYARPAASDDSPTFASLSSIFTASTPDFSGSDFSGGGGDFGGGGASGSFGGDS